MSLNKLKSNIQTEYENLLKLETSNNTQKLPLNEDLANKQERPAASKTETLQSIYFDLVQSWNICLDLILNTQIFSENCQDEREWLKQVLVHNVPHGKLGRGVGFIAFYRATKGKRTEKDDLDSYLFAWCLQMLQSVSLIADDIMDNSVTRRGKLCWYKKPHVGMSAVNDALLLENLVNSTLKQYFENRDNYLPLVRIVQKVKFYMILGQNLDSSFALDGDILLFDMKMYQTIVKLKTSYFTFYGPIMTAQVAAGITDPSVISEIESITLEIGELFQIQDDYLDCFGDPNVTGKIGTDIVDRKANWLFVKAMELGNEDERNEIMKNYGQNCPIMENRVKELYKKLNIPVLYELYEESTFNKLCEKIKNLPPYIPKYVFLQTLEQMYHRQK